MSRGAREFYGDWGPAWRRTWSRTWRRRPKPVDWAKRKQKCEGVSTAPYLGYLSRSDAVAHSVRRRAGRRDLARGLAPYKVLILPNSACLSDAQIEAIKRFVRGGGAVMAEFETGAFNELGRPREANPLLGTAWPERAWTNDEAGLQRGVVHLHPRGPSGAGWISSRAD